MKRFELEPRATEPPDFLEWFHELAMLADAEGEQATIGILMQYAPVICVEYLGSQPELFALLLARARFADQLRWYEGVRAGRRMRA
jgi:hypothetical protein